MELFLFQFPLSTKTMDVQYQIACETDHQIQNL